MNVSRKNFLRGGAAAWTAGLFNLVPSSVFGAGAPSNRITLAMIGSGNQGCSDLGGFLGCGDVVVRAVCDVNKKKTEKAKQMVDKRYNNTDCLEFEDFREVCDRPDIDTVLIATPDHWHAYVGTYALAHGKDCYGEKPLTHDLKEGRALCEAVKKYGRVWQTGSQQRSGNEFRRAVELVRNGRLGKIARVEVGLPGGGRGPTAKPQAVPEGLNWNFWLGPAPERPFLGVYDWNWRWVLEWGGGQLMDWIGHHADIAQWGVGLDHSGPVSFKGYAPYEPENGIYDSFKQYHVECKYANGIELAVASDVKRGGCTWYGENGEWIHVNRGELNASNNALKEATIGPGELHLESNGHQRDFIDAVKSRDTCHADVEVAHRSASVGHLCQIALLTGREIKWDPATETIIGDKKAEALLGRAPRGEWKLY